MVLKCQIQKIRKRAGMSQADLALKAEIHISMISYYENGKSTPTVYTLWKLANALNCLVDELYEEE